MNKRQKLLVSVSIHFTFLPFGKPMRCSLYGGTAWFFLEKETVWRGFCWRKDEVALKSVAFAQKVALKSVIKLKEVG